MKKLIYGILFLVLVGIGVVGCKKDDRNQNDTAIRYKSSDFEFIGVEHNKLLDETFLYLNENIESVKSLKEVNDFLSKKIDSYTRSSKESIDFGKKQMIKIFSNIKGYKMSLDSKEYIDSFSGNQQEFLTKLDDVLSNQSFSTKKMISEIEELEDLINLTQSLTNDELVVIYSATITAKYSLSYWKEGYSKWRSLSGNIAKAASPGGNIAKGDVAGAAGGAAGAVAVNVIPGAGQVAYGGAIIGSAVAGSVGVAVYELFDWLGW